MSPMQIQKRSGKMPNDKTASGMKFNDGTAETADADFQTQTTQKKQSKPQPT